MKSKQEKTRNPRIASVGGQAVIEGVMMRGKKQHCTAVRTPSGGIVTDTHKNDSIKDRVKILKLPILRGVVNFIEMMTLSFSTINFSADAATGGIESETKFEKWLDKTFGKSLMTVVSAIGMVLGLVLSVFLFIYLPAILSGALFKSSDMRVPAKIFEGLIKIVIFIGYISLVTLMKDMRRTFEYHGAEHKSIFCYEKGLPLTVENIKKQKRFHPRCGTSFLIVMMLLGIVLSIIISSLMGDAAKNSILYTLYKVLSIPLLVGIGYEIIIYSGKHDNAFVRALTAPGLWMQRLTTREPDASQIEVAIVALKSALPDEFGPQDIFEGIKLPDAQKDIQSGSEAPAAQDQGEK
ncbi:MAG: DUF1385 domain-containing protein [Oscillospiraceae bacterium]|nr:DUF1385 domain-containing protein [Oscillospiraceae bacterium]